MARSSRVRIVRLTDKARELLQRYAAGHEQQFFQSGRTESRCRSLWKRGLLVTAEQEAKTGWLRYEITELGQRVAALKPGKQICNEGECFQG